MLDWRRRLGYVLAPVLVMLPLAGRAGGDPQQTQPAIKILTSFEKQFDPERGPWRSNTGGGTTRLHATHGSRSLWTVFSHAGAVLWCVRKTLEEDWSGYEKLKVDVFVDGVSVVLTIELRDRDGNRYIIPYYHLRPGPNTVEVDLRGLAEQLDIKRITNIFFRAVRNPAGRNTCYFDSVRLTRGVADTVATDALKVGESPVVAGNLVGNSGFEYGLGGWQFWGRFDFGEYRVGTASGKDPHSGVNCATIKAVGYFPARSSSLQAYIFN